MKVGRRGLIVAVGAGVAGMFALRTVRPRGDVIEQGAIVDQVLAANEPAVGPRDADVRVAVFTDYRCPNCRAAHAPMLDAAREAGVLLLLRDWPILGPASLRAARVALACLEQDRYLAVHDALMRGTVDEPGIARAVAEAGVDWPRAVRDADAPAITARLQRNANQAFALGYRGTPGYLAGPIRVEGALDRDGFAALFERARRELRRRG